MSNSILIGIGFVAALIVATFLIFTIFAKPQTSEAESSGRPKDALDSSGCGCNS
jgi:flagellar basal body-associated protein FliL